LQEAAYNVLNIAMVEDVNWIGVLVACSLLFLASLNSQYIF